MKKYEITKTIRFKAIPKNTNAKKVDLKNQANISRFLLQIKNIQREFLDIFVCNSEKERLNEEEKKNKTPKHIKLKFKRKRKVKYGWLRSYTKINFYKWKEEKNIKNEKSYELIKIGYLPKEFLRWLNKWQELSEKLEKYIERGLEEQERKSEIAFVLREFLKRQNFEFIQNFVNAVMDLQNKNGTEEDEKIKKLRELLTKTYENLKACEQEYLPEQSGGICLYKASLNYYTLNKTPKEYGKLRKKKNQELEYKVAHYLFTRKKFNKDTRQQEILFSCSDDWLIKIRLGVEIKRKSLDEAYQKIKTWKAKQKSDFNEKIGNLVERYIKKEYQENSINEDTKTEAVEILKSFPLFVPIEIQYFYDFLEKTKEIKKLSKGKNDILQKYNVKVREFERRIKDKQKNKIQLTDDESRFLQIARTIDGVAKERGKFFNTPQEKNQTQNYFELCELYKRIAMKRGKIIAEIKGLRNEEVQSQMLSHWALIAEKGDKKYAVFVPRESEGKSDNHKKAHDWLKNNKEALQNNKNKDITIYHFKSLTFRALEKLCFKRFENTFISEIQNELKQKGYTSFPGYKEEWRKNEKKLIQFYLDVLQTKYVKRNLDLIDFGGLDTFLNKKASDFENLQEFESELEKICYVKIPLYFSQNQFDRFIETLNAKVFEITTRSISKESRRKENAHAKIWFDFWDFKNKEKNYITRLNPEWSVFYREEIKEKSNKGKTNKGIENRYSKERFTVVTTITLNAMAEKMDMAFKTTDELKKKLDNFNEKFNQEFEGDWVYGIDRGIKELATLHIVKFGNAKNKFGVSQPKEFAEIPVYRLKDENVLLQDKDGNVIKNIHKKERKVINNISEVLKEGVRPSKELFEKDTLASIDLTQAKLIKGHIILKGDQKTYLKLKELSAKRRIFELFASEKIDKKSKFSFGKTIIISGKKSRYPIYWLTEQQKSNHMQQQLLEKILNNYLQELDEKNKFFDEETILKINHLRDAITANMVGIIFYLQNTLEMKGYIGLENMDIKKAELEKRLKENREKDKDLETGKESKMIDEHFDQSNEDISRRFEWALYRKFANTSEVPPQIKESILLREEFATNQFGIIKFVKIEGTSSNCPNCGEKSGKTNNNFVCKYKNSCTFDSREKRTLLEQNLNNSDEVAAYNVAKNVFDEEC